METTAETPANNDWAERHPFMAIGLGLGFLVGLFWNWLQALLVGLNELVRAFEFNGAPGTGVLVNMLGIHPGVLRLAGIVLGGPALVAGLWCFGWGAWLTWRGRWVLVAAVCVYSLIVQTTITLAIAGAIAVVDLVRRHFQCQRAILHELQEIRARLPPQGLPGDSRRS
ncbi:hypothetical protein OWM54_35570 [Myxococcus sp. MISCRS1]|uniref:hypothetical protein n=1 Tax=Myxococcus sp. MISCRS1 TaxID=2996786 RepID=UPI00226FD767|nr:hypothetical protein [Myxococcus sp. MISCRS1]MCY1002488.1 hypothetical protein [Myxococcus sp. MISCRS1]